jgi:hypothetical protein
MIVKLMSGETAPDEDSRKLFHLIADVTYVAFSRRDGVPFISIGGEREDRELESFKLEGNVYVMNDAGKTIASFGAASIPTTLGKGRG